MTAATASQAGEIGLVPAPQAGEQNKFLRGDATWQNVTWDNIENKPSTLLATDAGTSAITLTHGGKYKLTAAGSSVIFTMPSDNNTTYTFANGTNGFTVTPSGGSAQTVTVTPSIANNITGSGTSGYLTKFNGKNTITNGPQLSSTISNQSQTTKFLREDGTWAAPSYTRVKGNAETNYRTGDVNLTPANIGAATTSHTHGNITNDGKLGTASRAVITDGDKKITISSVTSTELEYLSGVTSAIQTQINAKAPLANPELTGTPRAPTADAGTNTTQIATTEFVTRAVSQGFVANDAMVFKGLIGSNQTITQLPTSGYNAGWTYRVANAGTFAGEYCEVGDLLIAINDGPTSGSSVIDTDWGKVEHNIDGALYKTNSVTYSGDKVLMSSGINGAVKEGTISNENVIKTITLSAGSVPTLGDAFSIPNVTENTSVTASKVTKSDNIVVKTISQASSTSSVIGTVANGVLTLTEAITAVGAVTAGSTATASAVTITDVTATYTSLGTMFTVPNVINVGTLPSLTTTTQSVITGIS